MIADLRDKGVITGWRNELYPVSGGFNQPPLLLIERVAAPYFGVKAYGVHVNGYVETASGEQRLWVARRSSKNRPGRGLWITLWPGSGTEIFLFVLPVSQACTGCAGALNVWLGLYCASFKFCIGKTACSRCSTFADPEQPSTAVVELPSGRWSGSASVIPTCMIVYFLDFDFIFSFLGNNTQPALYPICTSTREVAPARS